MFQGASVAFDLSMEEIWVPYLVGATLFVASPAMMGDVESLPGIISEAERITVLDTVPTLLAMISGDLPTVRLVLLGGEALPEPLVAPLGDAVRASSSTRTGRPRRPWSPPRPRCGPATPVTIGGPIAELFRLRRGRGSEPARARDQQGELLIGGPGVAKRLSRSGPS